MNLGHLFIGFLLILGTVLLPAETHALTVSPVRSEIAADPGSIIQGELLLINEQEGTRTFYSSSGNFEATGETGTPTFVEGQEGLASWVETASFVTLAKGEQLKVPYVIRVPKNADPGGHFAAIFWSTVPPASEGGVSIGAKIGSLILLRVSGEIPEGGGLLEFGTIEGQKVFNSLPVTLTYRFQNGGGDRLKPDGHLTIRNILWFKSTKLNANVGEGNVLPQSTRKFDVVWEKKKPEAGDHETKTKGFFAGLKNEWNNFAFGAYAANLDLNYGTGETAKAKTMFFVLPWRISTIFLVILAIVGFFFALGVKRYNRWIIKKAQAQNFK